jgi:hypothetical protein
VAISTIIKLMKKKSIILLALLILAVFGLPIAIENILADKSSAVAEEYSYKTMKIDHDKWGYLISHYDKPFIKQIYIPAMSGKVFFKTEVSAGKTARLVISKLNKKEIPSVTESELKELGVIP